MPAVRDGKVDADSSSTSAIHVPELRASTSLADMGDTGSGRPLPIPLGAIIAALTGESD